MIDLMQKCGLCEDRPYTYVKLTEHKHQPWTIISFRCMDCGYTDQVVDTEHTVKEYEALDK